MIYLCRCSLLGVRYLSLSDRYTESAWDYYDVTVPVLSTGSGKPQSIGPLHRVIMIAEEANVIRYSV